MADPNNANILIVTAVHGSTGLGVCKLYDFGEVADIIKLRGEGTLGPSAVGLTGKDLVCVVDFLVKGSIAPGTIGTLTLTSKDSDGNTITDALLTMVALGQSHRFDRDNPPGVWRQLFQHKGAMANRAAYMS